MTMKDGWRIPLHTPPPPSSDTYRFVDEGFESGGYGITVYGRLVSVLTEAYYITNAWEAEQYISGTGGRINDEATALYDGLLGCFDSNGDDGSDNCPPGKQKQGKC